MADLSPEAFLSAVYQGVLGREPDKEGFSNWLSALRGGMTPKEVIRAFIRSQEFSSRFAGTYLSTFEDNQFLTDTAKLDSIVQNGFSQSELDDIYRDEPANEYLAYHRRRFLELFCYIRSFKEDFGTPIKLLEVGTSYYTTYFYHRLFPEINLYTMCRPTEQGGPDEKWARTGGAKEHKNVDLNTLDFPEFAGRYDWHKKFDLIVCCEVIEHLQRSPIEIVEGLLRMLSREGQILITTPNFLSRHNLQEIMNGRNPSPSFDGFDQNKNAHHHYREYTLPELISCTQSAGGQVALSAYSNAWNPTEHLTREEYTYRSNLVLVVKGIGD